MQRPCKFLTRVTLEEAAWGLRAIQPTEYKTSRASYLFPWTSCPAIRPCINFRRTNFFRLFPRERRIPSKASLPRSVSRGFAAFPPRRFRNGGYECKFLSLRPPFKFRVACIFDYPGFYKRQVRLQRVLVFDLIPPSCYFPM